MTLAAAGGPTWTDILTAIGTVGAVIVALGIALYTDWRAGKRIAAEHERSDQVLGEERQRAASELAGQREHERAALEDERAYSRQQLEQERRLVLEQEQFAQAYAVQVVSAESITGVLKNGTMDGTVKRLGVIIVNRSSFTITRIEAQFNTGNSLVTHRKFTRMAGLAALPEFLRSEWGSSDERVTPDVLTPWNAGIRFETDDIHVQHLRGPYPIVRWTDRWGVRWEHKRGVVRQIADGAPWEP